MSGALGVGLATWPLSSRAETAGGKPALPNFIVYVSDDHGLLFSEPYGNQQVHTPNLAKLAAEGMTFTHAFNASPSCGPSRAAMLTGLWPARNGSMPNHRAPKPETTHLLDVLKELGYETVSIGKVSDAGFPNSFPWDTRLGNINGEQNTELVAKYLAERKSTQPLALFFGSHFPHVPWLANVSYDPAALKMPPTLVDTPVMREQFACYYTSVSKTDALLGEYRALVQKYVPGDSFFLYTADHGAQLPFSKWDVYDAGTRVPFIVAWPGKIKPGSTSDAMVCLPDLLPTLIELAGGKVPDGLDGQSFAGLLRGATATHRDHVFNACWGDSDCNVYPSRSLRTRDWKYIRNLHPEFQHHTHISRFAGEEQGGVYWKTWLAAAATDSAAAAIVKRYIERPAEELYDLMADPYEQHNLAADPKQADRLAAMRAELTAWMKQQGDQQTVFGRPLLIGQPLTMISNPKKSRKQSEPSGTK